MGKTAGGAENKVKELAVIIAGAAAGGDEHIKDDDAQHTKDSQKQSVHGSPSSRGEDADVEVSGDTTNQPSKAVQIESLQPTTASRRSERLSLKTISSQELDVDRRTSSERLSLKTVSSQELDAEKRTCSLQEQVMAADLRDALERIKALERINSELVIEKEIEKAKHTAYVEGQLSMCGVYDKMTEAMATTSTLVASLLKAPPTRKVAAARKPRAPKPAPPKGAKGNQKDGKIPSGTKSRPNKRKNLG